MIRLCIKLAASFYRLLRVRAPSNVLLDLLRTHRGLKWAIPTCLVLAPTYLYVASLTTALIERGASGWLNLLVILLCWNALKFAATAVIGVLRLSKLGPGNWSGRRAERREGYAPGRELGPWTTLA